MDLRQLNYFVTIAETRHLGRAAERLRLSQPPLTRQIHQLEHELGAQLFRRTARGMELTQAGEELLRYARSIRALVEQAAEHAKRTGEGRAGRLDIGVYGSSVFGIVARLLRQFKLDHPHVELVLHHAQTPMQLPALRQGRVVLVFERLLPNEPDVEVELVGRESLLVALDERHPLASRRRIDVASLKSETWIIGTSPSASATAIELCRRHGFEPRFAHPVTDVVTAALLVAAGAGVTLVPESMKNVRYPGIVYRPLIRCDDAFMDLHCFYLRGETSPLLASMLESIRRFRRTELPKHLPGGPGRADARRV